MPDYPVTPRSRVRQLPARGSYDAETIHAIIDAAPLCHVAFIDEGLPVSIPINHARAGSRILLHGAPRSRLMRHLGAGGEVSISFALVDGLVVARSAFNHSQNYRSAVIFGRGGWLEEDAAKIEAFHAFVEKLIPGRWAEARPPSAAELRASVIAAVEIESASAKTRVGGPGESAEDGDKADLHGFADLHGKADWHGVVPLRLAAGPVEGDPPPSILAYIRRINQEGG